MDILTGFFAAVIVGLGAAWLSLELKKCQQAAREARNERDLADARYTSARVMANSVTRTVALLSDEVEELREANDRLVKELRSRPDAPYGLPCWGEWIQKDVINSKLDQGCVPVKVQGQWVFAMPIDEREVVSVLGPSLVGPPSHLRESLQCDPIFSEPSPN